ncbi:MAG: hypothetical protein IJO27_06045, partial [Bacilli bacterium]|nr:hypothetical protein [Bacilli bacterium]
VQKYLKLSDADLKLNDKLKQEEIEELNLAGGEGSSKEGEDQGLEGFGFGESIDYEKLTNMIVEKLTNKSILTEEKSNKISKVNKDKPKKKKSVKSKENKDLDKPKNKEEE